MQHLIDGWPIDTADRSRVVTSDTSVAGHRPALEDSSFALPGRRGKVAVPGPPGEQLYTLTVACSGSTYTAARLQVAELHRRIPEGRTVQLRRTIPGDPDPVLDVYAPAMVLAATDVSSNAANRTTLVVKIVFTLSGGVWLDAVPATVELSAEHRTSGDTSNGLYTLTPLAGGSAPMETEWTIVGNGSTTSVEVIDSESGAWWRLAGNITPGHVVAVDPLAHAAVQNGTINVAHLLTVSGPFYLSPDAKVQMLRNGTQATVVQARRSWYE